MTCILQVFVTLNKRPAALCIFLPFLTCFDSVNNQLLITKSLAPLELCSDLVLNTATGSILPPTPQSGVAQGTVIGPLSVFYIINK